MRSTASWPLAHWLALANLALFVFAGLPVLAPIAMGAGLAGLAEPIYSAYTLVCHQWAHRSFFLLGAQPVYTLGEIALLAPAEVSTAYIGSREAGYKVAYCERDLAIYGSIFIAGLLFAWRRTQTRPLSPMIYALALVPIAIDGFTQLFGWRESTPLLRVLTGTLFGAATVWLLYPRIDLILRHHWSASVPPASHERVEHPRPRRWLHSWQLTQQ